MNCRGSRFSPVNHHRVGFTHHARRLHTYHAKSPQQPNIVLRELSSLSVPDVSKSKQVRRTPIIAAHLKNTRQALSFSSATLLYFVHAPVYRDKQCNRVMLKRVMLNQIEGEFTRIVLQQENALKNGTSVPRLI